MYPFIPWGGWTVSVVAIIQIDDVESNLVGEVD